MFRGRKRRWAAALALAVALAVPAASAQAAAGPESPGELVGVWEGLWLWVVEALDSAQGSLTEPESGIPVDPDSGKYSDHGSFIDPNG